MPATSQRQCSEADGAALSSEPLPGGGAGDDPAHLLFTSGSTGTPKGVIVAHRNVVAFVTWANGYFGVGETDRVSCHSPLVFDLSTWDLFGGFAAGAEVHLVPPQLNLFPGRLVEFIREHRLTQWFSVPSLLAYLARFDAVQPGDFPDLRRIIWCGEVFATPALRYWMERVPHASFTNLYGPTETTIASSYFHGRDTAFGPERQRTDRSGVPRRDVAHPRTRPAAAAGRARSARSASAALA